MTDCSPSKILLAMPCMDGKMYVQTVMGVMSIMAPAGGAIVPFWNIADSNIRHCRNACVHHFLTKTECDTLFFLDSDIVFTAEDFAYMMEGSEPIVIAPYARKILGSPHTGFGMGFCRIHRSVFDTLNAWTNEDGEEMLGRYYVTGEPIATDFFFDGASTDARWFGEDTGFWHFCSRASIPVRYEKRTRLGHVGQMVYRYPDQIPEGVEVYRGEAPYTTATCRVFFQGFSCEGDPGHQGKHYARTPGRGRVEWDDSDVLQPGG